MQALFGRLLSGLHQFQTTVMPKVGSFFLVVRIISQFYVGFIIILRGLSRILIILEHLDLFPLAFYNRPYQWVFFLERQIGLSYLAGDTEDTPGP